MAGMQYHTLLPEQQHHQLEVEIISAEHLKQVERFGRKMNPYAIVWVHHKSMCITPKTIKIPAADHSGASAHHLQVQARGATPSVAGEDALHGPGQRGRRALRVQPHHPAGAPAPVGVAQPLGLRHRAVVGAVAPGPGQGGVALLIPGAPAGVRAPPGRAQLRGQGGAAAAACAGRCDGCAGGSAGGAGSRL